MRRVLKPKAILFISLGIIIGGLLFVVGELDDAPGLCAIGLSVGFLLIMFGVNNTGVIKKGLFAPILMLSFAAFIGIITTSILLEGEFGDKQWYSAYGFVVAMVLLLMGFLRMRAFRRAS